MLEVPMPTTITQSNSSHSKRDSINMRERVMLVDNEGNILTTNPYIGTVPELYSFPLLCSSHRVHPDDIEQGLLSWQEVISSPSKQVEITLRVAFPKNDFENHTNLDSSKVTNDLQQEVVYRHIRYIALNLNRSSTRNEIVVTARDVTDDKQTESLLADEANILGLIALDTPLTKILEDISNLVESHTSGACGVFLIENHNLLKIQVAAAGSLSNSVLELAELLPVQDFLVPKNEFDSSEPLVFEDFETDERTQPFLDLLLPRDIQACWAMPVFDIVTFETLAGIVCMYPQPHIMTDHDKKVAVAASQLTAIALERSRWKSELFRQVRHHPLTGLPNRSLIQEYIAEIGTHQDNYSSPEVQHTDSILEDNRTQTSDADLDFCAIVFIGIDRFKLINESFGHATGDILLLRFSQRITQLIRPEDFIGHLGGDEFVIVLENIPDIQVLHYLHQRILLALEEPFEVGKEPLYVHASMGAAVISTQEIQNHDLLHNADVAMKMAKKTRQGELVLFSDALDTKDPQKFTVDHGLRTGLEKKEFLLHYQPEIHLATGKIMGAEALIRWNHPQQGLLPPIEYIAIAEETGFIVHLGKWVLDEALRQVAEWKKTLQPQIMDSFIMSVNLSPRQIFWPGLVEMVKAALEKHQWPGNQLILEITESIFIDDYKKALRVIEQCKKLGVKIAIDDFGTGFSSLKYLEKFPIDIVKIDREFIHNLKINGEGSPIASAVTNMAHAFGMNAVAEGIETTDQLAGLRAIGCDIGQGYLFAKPLPHEEFEEFIKSRSNW